MGRRTGDPRRIQDHVRRCKIRPLSPRPALTGRKTRDHASLQDGSAFIEKAGEVLLVPRPSHSRKDPAEVDEFRQSLAEYLENRRIPEGGKVRLRMMDETRFGQHTEMRLRARKGKRPILIRQIKYERDYLFGSLDVAGGQANFCEIPAVNQELIH
jgi:hypothetical protein